jgi:enamine deaminase RidA (YjgF/YER057c/UK114 family)
MSKRKSINIGGFKHTNPIPNASRIGDIVMSGVIIGVDPSTGKLPSDLKQQCANMFGHVRNIVQAAGCSVDDIIKMTIWLKDPADRAILNEEWIKMFPDVDSRPARHALPHTGAGEMLILCDVTAVAQRV